MKSALLLPLLSSAVLLVLLLEVPFATASLAPTLLRGTGQLQPYGGMKDIIVAGLKELEGRKEQTVPELELGPSVRFADVTFLSEVAKITSDIEESGKRLWIRNITLPVSLLQLEGRYRLADQVLPGGLVIYGEGNFTVRFVELKAELELKTDYSLGTGKWTVKDLSVNTSLGDSLIHFENLMDGEPIGDFLNKMVDEMAKVVVDLLPGFVRQYKEDIMRELSNLINGMLSP